MPKLDFVLPPLCLAFLPDPQGETTSAISGTVVDASGAAIPGATVTLVSTDMGSKRTAITDRAGRFDFPQLRPGSYSVKVEADGFATQIDQRVSAALGQNQTVNFTLKWPPQKMK